MKIAYASSGSRGDTQPHIAYLHTTTVPPRCRCEPKSRMRPSSGVTQAWVPLARSDPAAAASAREVARRGTRPAHKVAASATYGCSPATYGCSLGSIQVLIKCWDSHGRDFAPHHQTLRAAARAEGASLGGSSGAGSGTVPATFSLHSGFEDPATPLDAPDRESIEVRVVAFFEDD